MSTDSNDQGLAKRLKRPPKLAPRLRKSSPAPISAPQKAAGTSAKASKSGTPRRAQPFNKMLGPGSKAESQFASGAGGVASSAAGLIADSADAGPTDPTRELERALEKARVEQLALTEELAQAREHARLCRSGLDKCDELNGAARSRSTRDRSSPDIEVWADCRCSESGESSEMETPDHELRRDTSEPPQHTPSRSNMGLLHSEAEWNELIERLHRSEKESQERLQRLLDLKQSVSTFTRIADQTTDGEIVQKMDQLYHRVREWVVSNYRRSKLRWDDMSPETTALLESIDPRYRRTSSTDKIALFQAIVAKEVARLLQIPFLIGLSKSGFSSSVGQVAEALQEASSDFREWCRVTIRAVEKTSVKEVLDQERLAYLRECAARVQGHLCDVTRVASTDAAHTALVSIFHSVTELHRTLLLQRARYRVHFFCNRDSEEPMGYDASCMDSINDDARDSDDEADVLLFSVFPLLEKHGNEMGENADMRNVLLKGRVCCGVG